VVHGGCGATGPPVPQGQRLEQGRILVEGNLELARSDPSQSEIHYRAAQKAHGEAHEPTTFYHGDIHFPTVHLELAQLRFARGELREAVHHFLEAINFELLNILSDPGTDSSVWSAPPMFDSQRNARDRVQKSAVIAAAKQGVYHILGQQVQYHLDALDREVLDRVFPAAYLQCGISESMIRSNPRIKYAQDGLLELAGKMTTSRRLSPQ
jgi:hypothetical protein